MRLIKYELYETRQAFYIVGRAVGDKPTFRILELLLSAPLSFAISELETDFSQTELEAWIEDQKQAAAVNGDEFRLKSQPAFGLLGLIRFTSCYYLCMVTKCSVVALLGGHRIYHIDETKLVPLVHSKDYEPPDRRSAEARLASTFHSLDLANTFYFSPTYDLSSTLQANLDTSQESKATSSIFVWNKHLLTPLAAVPAETRQNWFLEIIHGFIDQARISVFGNSVYITLIARRSHQFAGARFYKRGVNNQGFPANEVETEQIVSNQLRPAAFGARYTSYVQHRGSICVSWSQLANNMSPQPPIRIDAVDPYYEAAAKHFNRMFARYRYPIRVLNLVKTREKRLRESLLSREFENCIKYLSQFLPQDRKLVTESLDSRVAKHHKVSSLAPNNKMHLENGVIEYTHWDMSRAAKSQSSEVIDYLERYAHKTLQATSIFHAGKSVQNGVCRTNCIDCLDRTNAAQSVIAKHALGYQLYALGITEKPKIDYDTDVMDLLTEMYHDHGDTLALQYGGSNLVNTVETYRRINQWSSHSRDLIESIRRFYSNSFMDAQRQDAINVFLGNYQYSEGTNLWDLATDYYLHNSHQDPVKNSYQQWFEPRFLKPRVHTPHIPSDSQSQLYEKQALTSLNQLFMARMNSTDKYSKQLSPFKVHAKPPKKKELQVQEEVSEKHEESNMFFKIDEAELLYGRYLNMDYVETNIEDWSVKLNEKESLSVYENYMLPGQHDVDTNLYNSYVSCS